MGTLRVLLALSVVIGHAGQVFGHQLVGGVIAVQSFYVISGFYMGLVLSGKYGRGPADYRLFLSNRLLRLFPIYWIVLAATVACFGFGMIGTHGDLLSPGAKAFLSFSNLFIVGQDLVMFMGRQPDGGLRFVTNFHDSSPPMFQFLMIPQAWTLGLELMFYLIAPFLVSWRSRGLVLLMAASLMLRLWIHRLGIYHDPWTYRFFPTELFFFGAGILTFRTWRRIPFARMPEWVPGLVAVALLLFTLAFERLPGSAPKYLYFAAIIAGLPWIHQLTRSWSWDRRLGELSYPIYISHVLVLTLFNQYLPSLQGSEWKEPAAIAATLGVSWALAAFIAAPIETWRQRRVVAAR